MALSVLSVLNNLPSGYLQTQIPDQLTSLLISMLKTKVLLAPYIYLAEPIISACNHPASVGKNLFPGSHIVASVGDTPVELSITP